MMCLFLHVHACHHLRSSFLVDNGSPPVKATSVAAEVLPRNGRSLDRKLSFKLLAPASSFLISVICGCVGIIAPFSSCIFEKKKHMGQ